jgi:hypothetical protein
LHAAARSAYGRDVEGRASDISWNEVVDRIRAHEATPFLGAGVSRPPLPDGGELADELVAEYERSTERPYPFKSRDLMHVAQYWATMVDNQAPKRAIKRIFDRRPEPEFTPDQPHCRLAALDCPVYLTTNYDLYMERALELRGRQPETEVCRWSSGLMSRRTSYLSENEPTVQQPVVFHLHGQINEPESMVLSEDDYLDFMVNARRVTTSEPTQLVLPLKIDELLTQTSLLFLGYGLRDWNLRVLLRALVENADRSSQVMGVSVQLEPRDVEVDPTQLDEAVKYLEKYFDGPNLKVFWGRADSFLEEITRRLAEPVPA